MCAASACTECGKWAYHNPENRKGGITLASTGYIQVHAFTSIARIPLEDVAIAVTDREGNLIALRLTDRSGKIDPIPITVPDFAASQTPDPGIEPFTQVNLFARLQDFGQIEVENLQVFAQTVTDQNLEMIPLAEFPDRRDETEVFETEEQNL